MKQINFSQLQSELEANGIPEFCRRLKLQNGYDAVARKQRLNPMEEKGSLMLADETALQTILQKHEDLPEDYSTTPATTASEVIYG